MKLLIVLIFLINVVLGANICSIKASNGGIIDLSALKLSNGGYYTGSFFDPKPKSFSLLFNICGDTPKCNELGNNYAYTNAQSCAFYQFDGTAPPMGYSEMSTISLINGGVSLTYSGGKNGTNQLDIYCDMSAKSPSIYDCIRINSIPPVYKCSMYSMYACPTITPTSTPTSTPTPTPTPTPDYKICQFSENGMLFNTTGPVTCTKNNRNFGCTSGIYSCYFSVDQ